MDAHPANSGGHPYDIPFQRRTESVPYSHNNLGEAAYTPASHDAIVDRYVRLTPVYTEPGHPQPVSDANGYGGTPLRNQTRPNG